MADWRKIRAALSREYLDFLPEEIYDKSDGSHIVRILDALCGDSGTGGIRKRLLLKRLQTSLSTTRYGDLDTVYSQLFDIARLPSEEYTYSSDALLTTAELDEMAAKDAHYRTRIWAYMTSFMYGATVEGLELCAKAGVGDDCQIIDLTKYWRSIGLVEGETDNRPLTDGSAMVNNGSRYLVVVMRDATLTAQESKSICDCMARLAPTDARFDLVTRDQVGACLGLTDISDIERTIRSVDASTNWWEVLRYVTGRADWDYKKYPSLWIEPNVKKEAPRQALVDHQEESDDYTYLASSCEASTEHIGYYDAMQQSLFSSLTGTGSDDLKLAKYALSKVSSRWYTSSFYGGDATVDFSYPIDLVTELTSDSDESSRGVRFWSSAEALTGDEWLRVDLKRTIPMNTLKFNMSCKPIKATPYAASAVDSSGEPIWEQLTDSEGRGLSYTCRSWGASAVSGDMVSVSFKCSTLQANYFKIIFSRLDSPYKKTLNSNSVVEVETFPYSVEITNLQIGQDVFAESDYRDAVYLDPFGNKVETALKTMSASNVLVDDDTCWVSQPDLGADAVEYLILDVRDSSGAAQKIDYLDIDSIYDGCQMNIYSSDDEKTWTPYPGVYSLQSGRFSIAARTVSYIKLEFTNLCAIPYETIASGIDVETRLFPWSVRNEVATETSADRELSSAATYLTTADESSAINNSTSDSVGLSEAYDELDNKAYNVSEVLTSNSYASTFGSSTYRSIGDSDVYGAYGTDMAVEQSLTANTQDITAVDEQGVAYFFPDVGAHDYDIRHDNRTYNLAYIVGIRYIKVGLSGSLVNFDGTNAFVVDPADDRYVHENAGWTTDGDMMKPGSSSICSLETSDIATAMPFRTFDFAVNQSEPDEKFDYPSDLSKEWSGVNSTVSSEEFGTNGTTLMCTPGAAVGYGITSDSKLTHSESIAKMQVDMFTEADGKWQLECVDTYGEQVFSMIYDVPKRTWTTVGTTFTPQPGGGWWNRDYSYRVALPLDGPLVKGQSVFLPVIDYAALKTAGIETGSTIFDMKDLHIIYFNGISCEPIPVDITGNEQVWFNIQQDVPSGESADGAYHRDVEEFYGSYYLYFGDSAETDAPDNDYTKLFTSGDGALAGAIQNTIGTTFTNDFDSYELDDVYRMPDGAGYLTLNLDIANEPLVKVASGASGTADVRYLLQYEDEEHTMSLYFYEKQLFFKIVEQDGFENLYVSQAGAIDTLLTSATAKLLVAWGARGSAQVYHNGVIDTTDTTHRREMRLYLSDGTGTFSGIPCINNVYDEIKYDNGLY